MPRDFFGIKGIYQKRQANIDKNKAVSNYRKFTPAYHSFPGAKVIYDGNKPNGIPDRNGNGSSKPIGHNTQETITPTAYDPGFGRKRSHKRRRKIRKPIKGFHQ